MPRTGSYGVVTSVQAATEPVDGFQLFPNPATTEVQLRRTNSTTSTVRIVSLTGQEVDRIAWPSGARTLRIGTAQLPAGLYVVEVIGTEGRHTTRLVKTNE